MFAWLWLVAGDYLLWENSTADWLVAGADLVWENNIVGWLADKPSEHSENHPTEWLIARAPIEEDATSTLQKISM